MGRYAPIGKTLGNAWRVGYDVNTWGGVLNNAIAVDKSLVASFFFFVIGVDSCKKELEKQTCNQASASTHLFVCLGFCVCSGWIPRHTTLRGLSIIEGRREGEKAGEGGRERGPRHGVHSPNNIAPPFGYNTHPHRRLRMRGLVDGTILTP